MKVKDLLKVLLAFVLIHSISAGGDDPCGKFFAETDILDTLQSYEDIYYILNSTARRNMNESLSPADVIVSHQIMNSAKILSQSTAIFDQVNITVHLGNLTSAVYEYIGNFFTYRTLKEKKLGRLDLAIKQGDILIQEADDAFMKEIARIFEVPQSDVVKVAEGGSVSRSSPFYCIADYLIHLRKLKLQLEVEFKVYSEKVRTMINAKF